MEISERMKEDHTIFERDVDGYLKPARLVDADKLHYKKVWMVADRDIPKDDIVVFAKELDKAGKKMSTVGDVIKAMFPNCTLGPVGETSPSVDVFVGETMIMRVDRHVWNTPYRGNESIVEV